MTQPCIRYPRILKPRLLQVFELPHRTDLSKHELDQMGGQDIGFDGKCVGLELGVGFPLLSR